MTARVLLATPLYPPEGGGPATFAASLERLLPEHDIEVRTIPFSKVRHLSWGFRHVAYARLLIKEGKKNEKVHMVLALDPISVGFPAWIASRWLRIPLLLRVVGDYAWEQGVQRAGVSDTLDLFLKKRQWSPLVVVLQILESFVARGADAVVVPSKYLGGVVEMWGVSHERVSLIYNGFKREAAGNASVREKLNITNRLVISVGRCVPWKGFHALFDVIPALSVGEERATLVVVGDGPEKQTLEKRAHESRGLGFMLSGVSHRTLLGYMKEADVFVLNTAYEGFSHLILEAMSIGVPVVTTHVGGNPELVRHNEDGILVSFNDKKALTEAIRSLLSPSTMRSRLIATARRTASQFTEERMGREYAALIHSFVNRKKS